MAEKLTAPYTAVYERKTSRPADASSVWSVTGGTGLHLMMDDSSCSDLLIYHNCGKKYVST